MVDRRRHRRLALLASLYAGVVVQPEISALRPQLHKPDTQAAVQAQFDGLHQLAVELNGGILIATLALVGLLAGQLTGGMQARRRPPRRTSDRSGDAALPRRRFDLFGTLVHFRGRPDPRFEWLREPFAAVTDPRPSTTSARRCARSRWTSSPAASPSTARFSRDRFARALSRIGADASAAEALSTAHMGHLAGFTNLPDGHLDVVATLADRYRVGLVSNFDHAPTARAVLARHGLDRHLAATVISAEFGWRKPHPGIFRAALARLDVVPSEALYVGDTHRRRRHRRAGRGDGRRLAGAVRRRRSDPPPTFRIASLAELPALLGRRLVPWSILRIGVGPPARCGAVLRPPAGVTDPSNAVGKAIRLKPTERDMDRDVQSIAAQVQDASGFVYGLREEIAKVIVGQRYVVDRLLIGLLANGHILLEGVPGLAKTLSQPATASPGRLVLASRLPTAARS